MYTIYTKKLGFMRVGGVLQGRLFRVTLLFHNHAQQPSDVVARSAQHRVQTITKRSLQVVVLINPRKS